MKHIIIDKEIVVEVREYEVEAATPEEALEKYVSELAGSIEPINTWYEEKGEFSKNEVYPKIPFGKNSC